MKIKITFLLIILSNIISAQKDKTVYLDSMNIITEFGSHKYYRIVKDYNQEKSEYSVKQYYESGEMESEGISTSKEFLHPKGIYTHYYKNGNKKISIKYDDKGDKEGYCISFYENGENKFEGTFIKSTVKKDGFDRTVSKLMITNFWNKDKIQIVTDGNGDYTDDGYFDNLIKNSISSGKLENGFKQGVWTGSNKYLGISFTENFKNGELINGTSIDKTGKEYSYGTIDALAKPVDGMNAFYKYVGKNFSVQEDLKIKLYIVTKFNVTTDNKIIKVANIKSGGKKADDEAIRVISAFNQFISAEFRGVKVESTFIIPITIQATE